MNNPIELHHRVFSMDRQSTHHIMQTKLLISKKKKDPQTKVSDLSAKWYSEFSTTRWYLVPQDMDY